MRIGVVLAIAIGLFSACAQARGNPARAELVTDWANIRPGQKFHLAVKMTMQPGWHIYWINPGDAGLATRITFHAPDGFKVEPRPFPYPTRFEEPSGIAVFGYEDTALFIADVTAPADLKPQSTVKFSADVRWLVCKDVCLPGRARPVAEATVVSSTTPAEAEPQLFADWLARIPVPADEVADVKSMGDGAQYAISLRWHEPATHVTVFTAPGDAFQLQNAKLTDENGTTTYRFAVHQLDHTAKLPTSVPVLFVFDDARGQHRAAEAIVTVDKTN